MDGTGRTAIQVVITRGHFNDWDVKTSDLTQGTSFLCYPYVLDMFRFDLVLRRLNHSEIGMLVAPRAFMIEAGAREALSWRRGSSQTLRWAVWRNCTGPGNPGE